MKQGTKPYGIFLRESRCKISVSNSLKPLTQGLKSVGELHGKCIGLFYETTRAVSQATAFIATDQTNCQV